MCFFTKSMSIKLSLQTQLSLLSLAKPIKVINDTVELSPISDGNDIIN